MVAITSLYAALLALVFLWLSARVIRYRRAGRLSLGDEGDRELLRRMRAQANCAEYAPIGLILIALLELGQANPWMLHALGLALLAGRVAHGYGFSARPMKMGLRVAGTALTLTVIAVSALLLLFTQVV